MFENVLFILSQQKNGTTAKVHACDTSIACAKNYFDFVCLFFCGYKKNQKRYAKVYLFLSLQIQLAGIFKAANKKSIRKNSFLPFISKTDNKCKSKRRKDIVCHACHEMNTWISYWLERLNHRLIGDNKQLQKTHQICFDPFWSLYLFTLQKRERNKKENTRILPFEGYANRFYEFIHFLFSNFSWFTIRLLSLFFCPLSFICIAS